MKDRGKKNFGELSWRRLMTMSNIGIIIGIEDGVIEQKI